MDEWFRSIAAQSKLPDDVAQQLLDVGYVVMEGPVEGKAAQLAEAYDAAVLAAHPDDVSIRSSTRILDFVNRGPAFDGIYIYKPLLGACCLIIDRPFRLSTMHARTLEPGTRTVPLHVDFKRAADGWPMIGFILMVDEFRSDNGATRFVPGSHVTDIPDDARKETTAAYEGQELACGPAGSLIIYNGSIWHGYTANRSARPRRSLQGAFIRREAESGVDLPARMLPETIARISPLAKYLLNLKPNESRNSMNDGLVTTNDS